MKLAFATISCPDWDWDTMIEQAVKYGYDGIEVRCIKDVMYIPDMEPFRTENANNTANRLKKAGLEISCFNTSCSFHDMGKMDKLLKDGFETIDVAGRMQVPYIRVFGNLIPKDSNEDRIIHQVAFGMNTLARYGKDKNVSVLLETHSDFSSSCRVAKVMSLMLYENAGIVWDINHPLKFNNESIDETFNVLKPWLRHVHIKDSVGRENNCKYVRLGEGDVPIAGIIRLLKSMDYNGYLSLEWEKKWHPELDNPEIVIPFYPKFMKTLLENS